MHETGVSSVIFRNQRFVFQLSSIKHCYIYVLSKKLNAAVGDDFQGPLGFYKGMAAPVIGVTPIFAVSFFGYNVGKSMQQNKPDDPLTYVLLSIADFVLNFFGVGCVLWT